MTDCERMDDLQFAGLRILQKTTGFRFGMDAVLLSDFARACPGDVVADFGTGTGILPLLLWGRHKGSRFEAFEIQADMADMAARSVALNGLSECITVHHASVEQAPTLLPPCSVDVIVCNPPYGTPGATLRNPDEARDLARHQDERGLKPWFTAAYRLLRGRGRMALIYPATPGATLRNPDEARDLARHQDERGLKPWFTAAYRLLRGRGRMALIYPAPQMLELMNGLSRAGLTPKRFRLIYPRADKPANLVLVEACKDARPTLQPEPPLIVYEADGALTPELRRIYHQE